MPKSVRKRIKFLVERRMSINKRLAKQCQDYGTV